MVLHNDLPTLQDGLKWKTEVERIANRITLCKPPHVFGVSGDWGCGKTSFMRQLQHSLGGQIPDDGSVENVSNSRVKRNQKVITIWFDAWRYQNEPAPVVVLLHEMRRQIALFPRILEKAKKLGFVAFAAAFDSLTQAANKIAFEAIPTAEKILQKGEKWEASNYEVVIGVDSIRDCLQKAIKCLLPTDDDARIVIFIDDLDRCNPKAAIQLLDGLKIYMSIPQCIFVIGMNERVLVDAISDEVSLGTEDKKLRASHYLEKICTDIYRISPPPSPITLFANWINNTDQRKILINAVGSTSCLPPNPRRLKALANQWPRFAGCVSYPVLNQVEKNIWVIRVLIASYVHQFNRDLWERWHYDPDFWNEIKAWCAGEREEMLKPVWAQSLRLQYHIDSYDAVTSQANMLNSFLNPGDIDNFWIAPLILKFKDQLLPADFKPLLNKAG